MEKDIALRLHFSYWIAILISAIILISTEKWSTSPGFTTYLSNAATMTSLLLAVVAIFYSFISNDSLSRSLGSMTTVANEVKDARAEIKGFVTQTSSTNEQAARNNELVREASSQLVEAITSLKTTLSEISEQNESLRGVMSGLPSRFDQIESKVGEVAKSLDSRSATPQPAENQKELPSIYIDALLERVPLQHHLMLIACLLCKNNSKEIDSAEFAKLIDWTNANSAETFLLTIVSLGVCSGTRSRPKAFRLTAVHPRLEERARETYESYVKRRYPTPTEREGWMKKLATVEEYYSEQ